MPRILWRAFRIQTRVSFKLKELQGRSFSYASSTMVPIVVGYWERFSEGCRRMQHDAAVIGWKTIYGNNIETRTWTT